jgi:hypothetical protein
MDEIKLEKMGPELSQEHQLPRGVKAMVLGDQIIFVRSIAGRLMPVSAEQQRLLTEEFIK